jgi:hypothetical protein
MPAASSEPVTRSARKSPTPSGSGTTAVIVTGALAARAAAIASRTPLNHRSGWPSTSTRSGSPRSGEASPGWKTVLSIPLRTTGQSASGRSSATTARSHSPIATKCTGRPKIEAAPYRSQTSRSV